MHSESFIGYIPAITSNSLDMLETYNKPGTGVYIINPEEFAIRSLKKDFRALPPQKITELLSPSIPAIEIIPKILISKVIDFSDQLYMPDDEVTEYLIEKYTIPESKLTKDRTFYRWQKYNIPQERQIDNVKMVNISEYPEIIKAIEAEKNKSLDPWRQVACLLTDKNINIELSTHNTYMPFEYSGEISGDVRSNYSKGINIDANNAIHAEASLIGRAAKHGITLEGKCLFVSTFPCPTCAKLISETGISSLYFREGYTLLEGQDCLEARGIELFKLIND